MMSSAKWVGVMAAVGFLAGAALAGDQIAQGTVKTVHADKMEFIVTDQGGKDNTFTLGENFVINRDNKEIKNDLKTGDVVSVLYDKGLLKWTASYILVHGDQNKNLELGRGTIKSYEPDTQVVMVTDLNSKDWTFHTGKDTKVHLNKEASKLENVKLGDMATLLYEKMGDKVMVKAIIIERK